VAEFVSEYACSHGSHTAVSCSYGTQTASRGLNSDMMQPESSAKSLSYPQHVKYSAITIRCLVAAHQGPLAVPSTSQTTLNNGSNCSTFSYPWPFQIATGPLLGAAPVPLSALPRLTCTACTFANSFAVIHSCCQYHTAHTTTSSPFRLPPYHC
jgi:hypothetical protein